MTDFGERRRVLPKTGQTTSYRTGDDGDYEKGFDEAPRFKDVGDGTVVDNATGLMWGKDGNGPTGNNGSIITWANGIDYAIALAFAGYTGWRMPNVLELQSLIDYGVTPLEIYLTFDNVVRDDFWTSTTHPGDTAQAIIWGPRIPAFYPHGKAFSNRLFCCRDH